MFNPEKNDDYVQRSEGGAVFERIPEHHQDRLLRKAIKHIVTWDGINETSTEKILKILREYHKKNKKRIELEDLIDAAVERYQEDLEGAPVSKKLLTSYVEWKESLREEEEPELA